jgi:probable rRNA maturation factor
MIEIINRQKKYKINKKRLEALLEKLVGHYRLDEPEITLALVNNETIRELNLKYLKKNAPTDVLSFPIREKGPDGKYYLGDIVISVQKASDQAVGGDAGLEEELEALAIHGFVHLLGYEHGKGLEKEESKIKKWVHEG